MHELIINYEHTYLFHHPTNKELPLRYLLAFLLLLVLDLQVVIHDYS